MTHLRCTEAKDELFIESVYRSTREEELNYTNWPEQQRSAFIMMQSMAQLAEYREKYPGLSQEIIVYKKQDAGRFYTWENEAEIRLVDITLLPSFRGRGIGRSLIEELIKKANAKNKKVSLHVEPQNPALRLYRRLGFIHINNNGRYQYLERLPDSALSSSENLS